MKYPKVSDLVAGTASHLTVANPRLSTGHAAGEFDPSELARGTEVELEHTDDRSEAMRIAMDHLVEDPHYYSKLARVHLDNPAGLSTRGERMYEHVRKSYAGSPRAKEIASRTVLARAKTHPELLANPSSEIRAAAIEKFEQFHRHPPIQITTFKKGFQIPHEVVRAGRAKWTTYRSDKVDPATLKRPKRPVDYIHEHDAGVEVYLPVDGPELEDLELDDIKTIAVPRAFYAVEALVKLGESLGFCIKGDDGDDEFEGERGEELFCVPDGTCLLIVADRREVIAMIWGGALGVFGRGIDG